MKCIHCGEDATSSINIDDCTFYLCNDHFELEWNNRIIDGENFIAGVKPRPKPTPVLDGKQPTASELEDFDEMLEDLIGTRSAFILNPNLDILGKVKVSELSTILEYNMQKDISVYAIVVDDIIGEELLAGAELANVKFLVGMDSKVKSDRLTILTTDDL